MIWRDGERTIFNRRTMAAFKQVERSAAPRYWGTDIKNVKLRGKLRKPGVPVEFTIEGFRAWVLAQFAPLGAITTIPCPYCGVSISIEDFSLDHKRPASWSRDARHALVNLCLCCSDCNKAKGIMTDGEFKWFRCIILKNMPKHVAQHILRSLRIAEIQRQSYFQNKKARGGKSSHEQSAVLSA